MPTYYNGKEIRPTSKLSGFDLTGKSSITIGGKVTTLSTPPPPDPLSSALWPLRLDDSHHSTLL